MSPPLTSGFRKKSRTFKVPFNPFHVTCWLIVLGSLITALPSKATIFAYDSFEEYNTGELNGANGGEGFASAWDAQVSITEIVEPTNPLSFTTNDGYTIQGGSRALQFTGNNNFAAQRALTTPISDSVYFSFLIRMESGTINDNDFATLWAGEGTHIGAPAIGLKANEGPGDTDFMGRVTGRSEVYGNTQLVIGNDYLLVAELTKSPTSATFDTLNFWLNPDFADMGSPQGTSTGSITYTQFEDIGFRIVNLSGSDSVLVDSIIATDNWESIFIPEPSTFLALMTIFPVLIRRRRDPSSQ